MLQDLSYPSEFALSYSIQDAPVLLDSLQDFIICYPVNPADLCQVSALYFAQVCPT